MKHLGLILVFAAFLCGAFLSVLDPRAVNWLLFAPCMAIGAMGLLLHRRAVHAAARGDAVLSGNIRNLGACLERIRGRLEALHERDDLPTYEARFEIDRLFREDLDAFAEARESMIHVFGIQNYADVMSHFAAGERYINRVWSASTDGYVDEVKQYLTRARDQFREAEAHFRSVQSQFAGAAEIQERA
ncbi:hypothetical protein [Elongatibacter sediminis]|uniref:5-bromo-4-chloroindolyl phosphate hydrolysis protein n=1 Tax=Elongatibacter sediminis TaxID=3119006 RepID=A0AAW9RAX9_9GAMM